MSRETGEGRRGRVLVAAAIGAAFAYLFDPDRGRRRRKMLWERVNGIANRTFKGLERKKRQEMAAVEGFAQKAAHKATQLREEPKPQPNDATLAEKVKSEVLRGEEMPSGKVNINAENGVVVLRGEVERPELIEELVSRARKVEGVRDVENRLQLAPTGAHRAPGARPPSGPPDQQ